MTEKSLTQKDIDDLLAKRQTKRPPKGQAHELKVAESGKTIFKFNFRSQKKINKNQFLLLESLHKRFLRNIEASLTNLLNIPVIANITTTTELSYNEFGETISSPSCLYLLKVIPGFGKFILEIDSKFAFFIIDKVLGGGSSTNVAFERELSLIEERILSRIIDLFLKDLEEAWQLVKNVKFEIEGFYNQADYIQVIGGDERIFLVTVDVRGEKDLGFLNLCLPVEVLENFISKDKEHLSDFGLNRSKEQIHLERSLIGEKIKESVLPLKVVLGRTNLTIDEFLNMEAGDVLALDSKTEQSLDIIVGNSKMYEGIPFKNKRMMNVKVTKSVRNQTDFSSKS